MSTRRFSNILIIALLTMLLSGAADAAESPRPPCGGLPVPAYPAAIGASVVQSQTVTGWVPPACFGWDGPAPTLLVGITGRLHEPGGADALLARFGAISRTIGVRYWSVTEQAWQTLIRDAFAVTDAAGTNRRGDFGLEELRPGVPLYSAERDGRSSGVVIYGFLCSKVRKATWPCPEKPRNPPFTRVFVPPFYPTISGRIFGGEHPAAF